MRILGIDHWEWLHHHLFRVFYFSLEQQRSWWSWKQWLSWWFRGSGHSTGCDDRKCDHCGGTNHNESYWVKYGKPYYVRSLMVLHSHSLLLLHLVMQLLILILMMHSLLNLASLFNNYTQHLPLLPLLHCLIRVMFACVPHSIHILGHWFQCLQIYIWYIILPLWFDFC